MNTPASTRLATRLAQLQLEGFCLGEGNPSFLEEICNLCFWKRAPYFVEAHWKNQTTQEKTLGRPILLSKTCVTKSLIMQETKDGNSPMLHSATQTWKGKIRNERKSSTFIFASYEAAKHGIVSWRVTFHVDSRETCLAKPLYNNMSLARTPTTQQSQAKRLFQKQILPRKCSRFGSDGKARSRYFSLLLLFSFLHSVFW